MHLKYMSNFSIVKTVLKWLYVKERLRRARNKLNAVFQGSSVMAS